MRRQMAPDGTPRSAFPTDFQDGSRSGISRGKQPCRITIRPTVVRTRYKVSAAHGTMWPTSLTFTDLSKGKTIVMATTRPILIVAAVLLGCSPGTAAEPARLDRTNLLPDRDSAGNVRPVLYLLYFVDRLSWFNLPRGKSPDRGIFYTTVR